jgi:hypothetical protein
MRHLLPYSHLADPRSFIGVISGPAQGTGLVLVLTCRPRLVNETAAEIEMMPIR